jgi:CrcB protein
VSAGDWILTAVLGGLAAFARFRVDGIVSARAGRDFPFGTLAVNLSGAVVLGLLTGLALTGPEATLLGTATVGSYTTFSTWMLETHRLYEEGEIANAYANAVISLVVGLAAAAVGRTIGGYL